MAVVDIRRRTGYLFLGVIVGHVILISTQVTTKRGVPMLEAAVFGIFSEVQRGANTVTGGVRTWWQDYFALRHFKINAVDRLDPARGLAELLRLLNQRVAERSRRRHDRSTEGRPGNNDNRSKDTNATHNPVSTVLDD